MKTTLEWLKDFVPLTQDDKTFCEGMTMSGTKVEDCTTTGAAISRVISGRITAVAPHPDADRLVICQVDLGDRTVPIVTGAGNIGCGDIVPVALDGATLSGDLTIRSGLLRGQLSEGMLCSVSELGFTTADFPAAAADGIFVLPADTPVGQDVRQILQLDDTVVDFEITSNRVDCLSVEGLAREAAATFKLPFTPLEPVVRAEHPEPADHQAQIFIEAPDLCFRYCGRIVRDVQIKPSPDWLRRRLRGAGVRPINAVVDITNYVMLELGQPMHAFDLDQLQGRMIRVRRAAAGETLRTLDSAPRMLDPSMLVIADAGRAVALAGVMGAENSEVTEATRTVLFESATFNPQAVRQAARQVGLRTEASTRFEKGLDAVNAARAIDRACQLIEQLGVGRVCPGLIDVWPVQAPPVQVAWTAGGINRLLGTDIDEAWLLDCFAALGIGDATTETGHCALIPSFRSDLACEADLAEEAARFYGYNNIMPSLLSGKQTTLGGRTPAQRTVEKIKDILLAAAFYEVCTYSFESPRQMDKLRLTPDHPLRRQIRLINPLGEDFACMRTSMAPSLLSVAAINWSRSVEKARLFEVAVVYQADQLPLADLPREERRLAALAYDDAAGEGGQLLLDLKGLLDELFLHLGITTAGYITDESTPWLHPGRCLSVQLGGCIIGYLGELHPEVAGQFAVPTRTVLFDLALDPLIEQASEARRYRPLPRHPAATRDLALLVDRAVPAAALDEAIRRGGGSLLERVQLFDVYQGPQVAPDQKSLAYSLVFRAPDKTLSDEAIAPVMAEILRILEAETGARRRE
jgi:phenylalanyl-tRNA synthetase beta chain